MAPAQDQETEMQRPTFTETWMDLDSVIQREVRKINVVYYHIYTEYRKMVQMNLFAG